MNHRRAHLSLSAIRNDAPRIAPPTWPIGPATPRPTHHHPDSELFARLVGVCLAGRELGLASFALPVGKFAGVTNEELDSAIRKRVADVDFAEALRSEGVPVVWIDHGQLVRFDPSDGSKTRLG